MSRALHGGRWVGTVAALSATGLLAAACGGISPKARATTDAVIAHTSGITSTAQTGKGIAGEGPYPWKYPASGTVPVGSGKTINGVICTPTTPQFNSPYALPCIAKWSGNNGGATYDGVTGSTITIANRVFPETSNAEEVAAEAKQEGAALPQVTDQVKQVFLNYFNKVYDLYGRHVVITPVESTSNSTAEALNEDQTQACADADKIKNEVHAFGEWGIGDDFTGGTSGPFSVCAAQDHLVEFIGAAYFNEGFYQQNNPYVWGEAQNCTTVAYAQAESFAKLLAGKKAIYAGEADLRTKTRKFGIYVPNLPAYISCTNQAVQSMEKTYHVPTSQVNTVFTYGLDISTFQQSTQEAIVQFKAAGVTTIVTACDPFSLSLLTKAAAAQNYHPEWLLNGVALDDEDTVAQTYDAAEVDGHLFGQSEASPETYSVGPTSPAGLLYQRLTGHAIPADTDGDYASLVWIFDALQAAGPDLTPQNLARGVHALPAMGAPNYVYGKWNLNTGPTGQPGYGQHTLISDARFIYWNGGGTSPDNGQKGTYVAIFGGKRFSAGQWPTSLPKLFTAAGSPDPTCSC